jgi:hypothetical protein
MAVGGTAVGGTAVGGTAVGGTGVLMDGESVLIAFPGTVVLTSVGPVKSVSSFPPVRLTSGNLVCVIVAEGILVGISDEEAEGEGDTSCPHFG